jgi:hypothetical protein
MNNYVLLDGYKYFAPFKQWEPSPEKPMSYRYTWGSGVEVTYGPAVFKVWKGSLIARVTPITDFGSVANIRATLLKTQALSFQDHEGNTFQVHAAYAGPEKSISPRWDGPSNAIFFPVILVAEA